MITMFSVILRFFVGIFILNIMIILIYSNYASKNKLRSNTPKPPTLNIYNFEIFLKNKKFTNIKLIPTVRKTETAYIYAEKNSQRYLFAKHFVDAPINTVLSNTWETIKKFATEGNFDKVILYIYDLPDRIPHSIINNAFNYNIEIWDKFGNIVSTSQITTTSRLANTLQSENEVLEHKPNGVIVEDSCHIAPTVSPIEENPRSFFKKKGPQKL